MTDFGLAAGPHETLVVNGWPWRSARRSVSGEGGACYAKLGHRRGAFRHNVRFPTHTPVGQIPVLFHLPQLDAWPPETPQLATHSRANSFSMMR